MENGQSITIFGWPWKRKVINQMEVYTVEIRTKIPNNHVIAAATTKRCSVVQEKLKQSGKQLKETTNQLKVLEESTARLSNALRSASASSRRKRKAWVDCTTQYKMPLALQKQKILSLSELKWLIRALRK